MCFGQGQRCFRRLKICVNKWVKVSNVRHWRKDYLNTCTTFLPNENVAAPPVVGRCLLATGASVLPSAEEQDGQKHIVY